MKREPAEHLSKPAVVAGLVAWSAVGGIAAACIDAAWKTWTNDWLFYGQGGLVAWAVVSRCGLFLQASLGGALAIVSFWEIHRFLHRRFRRGPGGEDASRTVRSFARSLSLLGGFAWIVVLGFLVNRYAFKEAWRIENAQSLFGLEVRTGFVSPSVVSANLAIVASGMLLGFGGSVALRVLLQSRRAAGFVTGRFVWVAVASSLALVLLAASQLPRGDSARPSIVLISIDTLRADRLGCYRSGSNTSPNIDALAAGGILFEWAFSASNWTLPSHASIFTSQLPSVHGVQSHRRSLPPVKVTLAEILKNEGYRTAAFTGGYFLDERYGFGQGFDQYLGDEIATLLDEEWRRFGKGPRARGIVPRAVRWIRRHRDRPFLVFVHFWDTHAPYMEQPQLIGQFWQGPEGAMPMLTHEYVREVNEGLRRVPASELERIRALYDNEIRYADAHLGELFDELRQLGLFENTIIVLTSDHGDQLLEHGRLGHGQALFDAETRVPLVISYPRRLSGGRRETRIVQAIDIVPSLLDLIGVEPGRAIQAELQGKSLFRESSGKGPWQIAISEQGRRLAMRTADYRFVVTGSRDGVSEELFDLGRDPGERHDIAGEAPQLVKRFRAALQKQREENGRMRFVGSADSVSLETGFTERLRALGYLQ